MAIVHFPYGRTELTCRPARRRPCGGADRAAAACGRQRRGARAARAGQPDRRAAPVRARARQEEGRRAPERPHAARAEPAILPPMLEEIRRGNPGGRRPRCCRHGCHRATAPEELREKLGPGAVRAGEARGSRLRRRGEPRLPGDAALGRGAGDPPPRGGGGSAGGGGVHRAALLRGVLGRAARACSRASRGAGPCLRTTARPSSTIRGRARACSRATQSTGTWSGRRGGRGSPSSSTP